MTENEAIERIIRSACSSGKCYDARLYGEGNCEYDVAIIALKEVQQYRKIGTVEECREAVEKQKPKKPKEILRHRGGFEMQHCPNCDTDYQVDRRYKIKDGYCPACGKLLDSAFRNYCANCGQAIDENLEEMKDER